jgi:hypothetical protein
MPSLNRRGPRRNASGGANQPSFPTFPRPNASLPYGHTSAMCDGCGRNPIVGIRYKCLECADFDLCQQCHDFSPIGSRKGNHSAEHNMLKFVEPLFPGPRTPFRYGSPNGPSAGQTGSPYSQSPYPRYAYLGGGPSAGQSGSPYSQSPYPRYAYFGGGRSLFEAGRLPSMNLLN